MSDTNGWFPVSRETVLSGPGVYDLKLNDGRGEYLTEIRVNVESVTTSAKLDEIMTDNFDKPVIVVSARIVMVPGDESVRLSKKDFDFLIGLATVGANSGSRANQILNNKILFRIVATTR